jgi:hypothetical protein
MTKLCQAVSNHDCIPGRMASCTEPGRTPGGSALSVVFVRLFL